MHGWSNASLPIEQVPVQISVEVRPPADCGNDSAFTHCAFVNDEDAGRVCAFRLGSPLVCSGTAVAGFVITDGVSACETRNGSRIVRFNSAALYSQWLASERNATTTTTTVRGGTPTTTTTVGTTTKGAGSLSRGFGVFVILAVAILQRFL